MSHLASKKVTRTHTTAIEEVRKVVRMLEKSPEVEKIVLGVIVAGLPHGEPRLKCLPITGGLRVEVRGRHAKQQLFVYSADSKMTESTIQALFE
jgi:hypothetical protein